MKKMREGLGISRNKRKSRTFTLRSFTSNLSQSIDQQLDLSSSSTSAIPKLHYNSLRILDLPGAMSANPVNPRAVAFLFDVVVTVEDEDEFALLRRCEFDLGATSCEEKAEKFVRRWKSRRCFIGNSKQKHGLASQRSTISLFSLNSSWSRQHELNFQ
jgi:hypothetical protein